MNLRRVLTGVALAASATGILLVAPTAASADPNCWVDDTISLTQPSNIWTTTVTVTRDPCSLPVRAFIHCDPGFGTTWVYGRQVTAPGYISDATCPYGVPHLSWGHQVYASGQWVTYNYS